MERNRVRQVIGRQQKDRCGMSPSNPDSDWGPWRTECNEIMAQRQHIGSCKSICTKRERSESDREEGWRICLTILLGRWWTGDNCLCFASITMCLIWCTEVVFLGWMPLWPDPFHIPLSSYGNLHVADALMAFKCLTHAYTILVGLVLSWKEDKGETVTHLGNVYWGSVGSGAFGTHQRVTLARIPQLPPQHLPLGRGFFWERRWAT